MAEDIKKEDLKKADINFDVDYDAWLMFISTVMHEKNRHKEKPDDFIEICKDILKKETVLENRCFLAGLIEHLTDREFEEYKEIKSNKWILDAFSFMCVTEFDKIEIAQKHFDNALKSFKNHGIILSELDEAI